MRPDSKGDVRVGATSSTLLFSEIQVVVQMEPERHHGVRDLPEVNVSSLCPMERLPKGGCPVVGHTFSDRSGWVKYAGGAKPSLPANPSRIPGKKLASRGIWAPSSIMTHRDTSSSVSSGAWTSSCTQLA